jgi:hypothetical protein
MERTQVLVVACAILVLSAISATDAAAQSKITKCQSISASGSYVLGTNLTATTGSCLSITADFVTIDLNGFTIDCGGSNGEGVSEGSNFQGTTVRNGTVTHCSRGVNLAGTNALVEKVRAVSNTFEGITIGHSGIVKDSQASQNGGDGIAVFFYGLVTGSNSLGNGGNGISADNGSSVIGNTTSENTGHGVAASLSLIAKNTSAVNKGFGYSVRCPSNVLENMARGNQNGFPGAANFFFDTSIGACNMSNNWEP